MDITKRKHVNEMPYIIASIRHVGPYNFPKLSFAIDIFDLGVQATNLLIQDEFKHLKIITHTRQALIYNLDELKEFIELEKSYKHDPDKGDIAILEEMGRMLNQTNMKSPDIGLIGQVIMTSIESSKRFSEDT